LRNPFSLEDEHLLSLSEIEALKSEQLTALDEAYIDSDEEEDDSSSDESSESIDTEDIDFLSDGDEGNSIKIKAEALKENKLSENFETSNIQAVLEEKMPMPPVSSPESISSNIEIIETRRKHPKVIESSLLSPKAAKATKSKEKEMKRKELDEQKNIHQKRREEIIERFEQMKREKEILLKDTISNYKNSSARKWLLTMDLSEQSLTLFGGLDGIASFGALKNLTLRNNKISTLKPLFDLDPSICDYSAQGVLSILPSLQYLDLRDNNFDSALSIAQELVLW